MRTIGAHRQIALDNAMVNGCGARFAALIFRLRAIRAPRRGSAVAVYLSAH